MSDLPAQLGHIAWFIVLPLMLLIGLGFVLQRRLGLDLPTLTRLNFYVVVPGMVYTAVVESPLTLGSVGVVVAFTLAFMALAAVGVVGLAWLRGVPRDRWSPLAMTGIFYNAGNYGLPLQQLAFRPVGQGDAAMGLQVFVMLVQNITSFTLGVVMAASGSQDGAGTARGPPAAEPGPHAAAAAAVRVGGGGRDGAGAAGPGGQRAGRGVCAHPVHGRAALRAGRLCGGGPGDDGGPTGDGEAGRGGLSGDAERGVPACWSRRPWPWG